MRNIILFVLLAAASAEHVQLGFTKNVLQPFKLKQSVSTLERTGKPSFKPTRNPVLEFSPSEAPTGSPTYGSGWLIVNRNQGSCDVTPDSVLAVRTETCIKSYADNEDEFPYYIRASCYTDSAYVQFYYDEECTEQFEEGGIADIELGCETNEDSRFSSAYTFCSTDENDLPLSDFHSYSVLLGYGAHDGTCADDNIVKLLAWKDSACMSDEEGHSASIVWPDVYTYGSNEFCNGTDFTVTPIRKPDECVATQVLLNETSMTYGDANVTEGAFEGYYAGFQDTSNWQGSVKWIAFTARDDNLHFTAKQEVLGILPTDFNDNFDANEAVWANAIASTIGNGITADDVEITRLDLEIYELRRRSLSEGSTDVTYKVSFEAGKLEFYSEDEAYETLATALIAGVESGNFTMYLQEWNAELTTEESSGDLEDCSSSKVRVEYDGAPNPEDDDNDGSKWAERASANIISGVIIGIGIVLLAGLVFYAFKQCSAKKE